jgi:hypothetical protein
MIVNLELVSNKNLVAIFKKCGNKMYNPKKSKKLTSNNLLSLPCFFVRRTNGREPNYSPTHVMTSEEYLTIMQWKAMDRKVTKYILKIKRKEKQRQVGYKGNTNNECNRIGS